MFQSVIGQSEGKGRFGSGVWVSLAVHAGILGAALLVSGGAQKAPPLEDLPLVFIPQRGPAQAPAPRPAAPAPRPAAQKPPVTARTKPKPPLRDPRMLPPPVEPRPLPPDESPAEPASDTPDTSPAVADTSGESGPSGPVCAACVVGPALTARAETSEDVVPFGAGMTPPRLLGESVPLTYTAEASRARVQGLLIARCTITRTGEVQDCRVTKGLPFMDEAVLASLAGRRYQPVTFQGRPVNALYTFNVHLRMP